MLSSFIKSNVMFKVGCGCDVTDHQNSRDMKWLRRAKKCFNIVFVIAN